MKITDAPAVKVWDYYMEKIAKTDLGCELGDAKSQSKRRELVEELRAKLKDLGVE